MTFMQNCNTTTSKPKSSLALGGVGAQDLNMGSGVKLGSAQVQKGKAYVLPH